MHRPEIATIETFVAVVEAQGFTRAAKRLETTAGAVSRRIAALEADLGLRLLNRTTRRLREAAITGLGIVALPDFLLGDDLAAGRLVPVLTAYGTAPLACSALWPSRQFVPAKVRVFIEFLAETLGRGQRRI
jgi:DNA-binding transcriptional LysR family regulator